MLLDRSRHTAGTTTLIGVVLLALNLRAAIAALSPLLPDVQADLGLSNVTAGLLTTLPVLCFGLFAPVATLLGRWIGGRPALLAAMVGIVLGSAVRTVPGMWWMLVGTVLIGIAITIGNVLVPAVVKQDFALRQGTVTALTTAALTGGAALAAGVAAPLAQTALGWQGAQLMVGGLAVVAAVVWAPQLRHRHTTVAVPAGGPSVLTSPVTWALATIMGTQSLVYYALLAWLPALLRDGGVSAADAGLALGLFNLLGIATAVATPVLAARLIDQRRLGVAVGAVWAAGLAGLLVAPAWYLLWAAVTGLAQGAGIGLALALIVLRARNSQSARRLSGTVQFIGYLMGAAGPLLFGMLYDASAGWSVPLAALVLASVTMAAAGYRAGRDRPV
ncbi:MFS transporter [Micromonospora qiuiae]|uniref:MFS transporter n=2 Tax=Micromonospora qiuiae TaxID=502268 RepID=A0ABQ4J8W9_9ACTN|nr:MFS transporter [Micromonospora qiuiae]